METLKKRKLALLLLGSLTVFNADFSSAALFACVNCNNGNNGNNGQTKKAFVVPGVVTSIASNLNTVFSCTNLDPTNSVSVEILFFDASGSPLTVGLPNPNPLSKIGPGQTVTAVTNNFSYFPSDNTAVLEVNPTLSPGSAIVSTSNRGKISCAVYLIDGSSPPKPLMPLNAITSGKK
jgi:hypothetical protein